MSDLEYLSKIEIEAVKNIEEYLEKLKENLKNDNLSETEKELIEIKITSWRLERHNTLMFGKFRFITENLISNQERILDELLSGKINKDELKKLKENAKFYKIQLAENINISGLMTKLGIGSED